MHWSSPAMLPVGCWWLAICMLHNFYFDVSIANEHEAVGRTYCWEKDEPRCIQKSS
uniref:Uncharacterized protein n=1 Tax=Arundo donax TaxID=35708 RepID=A0A0A9AMC1_ARUDO